MSTVITGEPVPVEKLSTFNAILKRCGGRYIGKPMDRNDRMGNYRVSYEYADPEAFAQHRLLWRRATADVREVRKDQWWRVWLRRAGLARIAG